ncbi:MAG: TetR/AcrR family transcriptional regulator [Spirochaetales bacterium]|nr:TetR/AcrR family transcriptional regulator [Spirochaetales bacterium]
MQTKKDKTYSSIMITARQEFLKNGFKQSSMRTIAEKAEVGLSNIYNYFANKDQIFEEILAPAIRELKYLQNQHNCEENLSIDIFTSIECLEKQTKTYADLITRYKDEINLLFYGANSSKLENFKEEYINNHTKIGLEYMTLMKEKFPELNIEVTDFFIHTMSSWWIGIMGELAMHDLSSEELEKFIYEYLEFSTAGWKKVMNVK